MIKKFILVLALTGMTIPMFACNTTKGAGQDMQSAGQSIENSADRHGAQP